MLSIEALNSAQALTDRFDARGLIVTPIENTPLAQLVSATRSDNNFVIANEDGSVGADVESIAFIANKADETGASEHTHRIDEIAKVCIEAVSGHINFARSVVAPVVEELVSRTNEALAEITPPSLLGMEVIVFEEPAPILNPAFESVVRRFQEVPYDSPKLEARLPDMAPSDILELLKVGSASLDRDIAEWAASKGDVFFTEIWENVFQHKGGFETELNSRSFRAWVEHKERGLDHALAIFLLARHLFDDAPAGTEMELRKYEGVMAEYRDQAGARVCRELDDLDRINKLGLLVRGYTTTTITVNQSVYRKWLEDGGENEILFGNLLTSPPETTVVGINEKAGALKTAWARQCTLLATVEANKRHLRIKEILIAQFRRQLQEVVEEERAALGNLELVQKRFESELQDATDDDLNDLYGLALCLICHARFPQSSAYEILSGVERVKKANPSLDVREAASISVIEYIANWVACQMQVRSR